MSIMQLVRDWFEQVGPEHWNPDKDEDVLALRRAKAESEAATADLQRWTTGNIVEEALTGVIGRSPTPVERDRGW